MFTLILMFLLLPVLLTLSAFCSASETALFSLTQRERRQITLSRKMLDTRLAELLDEIRGLLITLLLTNMIANVLYFVISTVAMMQLQKEFQVRTFWLPVMSMVTLFMLIVFGEVLPKMITARIPRASARFIALPLWLIHRTIAPVRFILNTVVITPLARLIAPGQKPPELSSQELEMMLELSQHHGVIDASEEHLLQQVLSLSHLRVHDIMTPRVDIKAYDISDPPILLIELLRATRLERIVVYEDDLDHVVGLAYARQVLLRRPRNQAEAKTLVRQVTFVPETQRADKLLIHFRKTGTTMAVVVDEFGGTAGIVTLEDVVEQMVGHISGPYDSEKDAAAVEHLPDGRWRVAADLPIHEWNDAFGPIHHLTASVTTLGGLAMAKLGRLPRVNDVALLGNLKLTVEAMKGRRITSLLLELLPQEQPTQENTTSAATTSASPGHPHVREKQS